MEQFSAIEESLSTCKFWMHSATSPKWVLQKMNDMGNYIDIRPSSKVSFGSFYRSHENVNAIIIIIIKCLNQISHLCLATVMDSLLFEPFHLLVEANQPMHILFFEI
jgi:hypothetical protein